MTRRARKIKHYADIEEDVVVGEVLPEKKLQESLALWESRLGTADEVNDAKYEGLCRQMITKYKDRLDRLGVRTPCES